MTEKNDFKGSVPLLDRESESQRNPTINIIVKNNVNEETQNNGENKNDGLSSNIKHPTS